MVELRSQMFEQTGNLCEDCVKINHVHVESTNPE